jgi:hypothetical protein
MPTADLTGKIVMIAHVSTDETYPADLNSALKKLGATVVVSEHSARETDHIKFIENEIAAHAPKIDALILKYVHRHP